MIVIPAIDLLDGNVVRLKKGDYDKVTVYSDDPLEEARKFSDAGLSHIHLVDLNGAKEGQFVNVDYIKEIKKETGLYIQTGGGIRNYSDAQKLLREGISRIVCSSMAIKNRTDWMKLLEESAAQMVLGMDLKDNKIAYGGWLETSEESIDSLLNPMIKAGLRLVLCTDIPRDGMLQGVNVELYKSLQEAYPTLNFIASGGVASADDLLQLADANVYGVVVGRAYYEQKISLQQMVDFSS